MKTNKTPKSPARKPADQKDDEILINEAHAVPINPDEQFKQNCQEAVDKYIENCKRFDINIDPSVVISLQTGWHILQPSKHFREGAMLPLLGVLDDNQHVSNLNLSTTSMHDSRFRASGNGNSNARILNEILAKNTKIENLDLSYTGLDDNGLIEISRSIERNTSIKELNISSNHFGSIGIDRLISALQLNNTIKSIDVSRNALGFRTINALRCSCGPRSISLSTMGNFVFEEILNSVSHGVAFIFALVGANVLISDASDPSFTPYHFWACVIYSVALLFLFLSSCLFHSFFMMPETSRILQILDHVGIYLTIAGSYTPFLLISLHHSTTAQVLLVLEWIGCFCGSVFAACSDLNAPTTTVIELSFFLTMGLGIAPVFLELMSAISFPALVLLSLGGGCYLFGILFFLLGEYKPIYHCVWHLFVVAAAALHWFCVYFFIVRTDLGATALQASSDMICQGAQSFNDFYQQCSMGNNEQAALTAQTVLAEIQRGESARVVMNEIFQGIMMKMQQNMTMN